MHTYTQATNYQLLNRMFEILDFMQDETTNGSLSFYSSKTSLVSVVTEHYTPLDGNEVEEQTTQIPLTKDEVSKIKMKFDHPDQPFESLRHSQQINKLSALYTDHIGPCIESNPVNFYKNYALSFFSQEHERILDKLNTIHSISKKIEKQIDMLFKERDNLRKPL